MHRSPQQGTLSGRPPHNCPAHFCPFPLVQLMIDGPVWNRAWYWFLLLFRDSFIPHGVTEKMLEPNPVTWLSQIPITLFKSASPVLLFWDWSAFSSWPSMNLTDALHRWTGSWCHCAPCRCNRSVKSWATTVLLILPVSRGRPGPPVILHITHICPGERAHVWMVIQGGKQRWSPARTNRTGPAGHPFEQSHSCRRTEAVLRGVHYY